MATLTKPRLIGCVSIDSGAVAIVDPCHLEVSDGGSVRLPDWRHCTAVDTELGDGELTVYEQRDYRGKLRRVIIEFD